ncbi:unnamed protein product, partial [Staurois parvus]
TQPPTTAHTNHTTQPPTTAHTNHTTQPPTTAHTNHTTAPHTTAHTNHTTAPHTSAHTNHTTQASTTAPSNHTSTPHTNHTTPHTTPSPLPPPTEYFVNGTSGVCLRIKAVFILTFSNTTFPNYTVPAPPTTKAKGSCSPDTAELMLTFPDGSLSVTFKKDQKKSSFYLAAANVTAHKEAVSVFSASLNEMVTPLGHAYTCKDVNVNISSTLKLLLMDVKAQAIELKDANFGQEMNCSDSHTRSKTVPIVVGIVLLVLIVAVVAAYFIARKCRHRSAGYQPL